MAKKKAMDKAAPAPKADPPAAKTASKPRRRRYVVAKGKAVAYKHRVIQAGEEVDPGTIDVTRLVESGVIVAMS